MFTEPFTLLSSVGLSLGMLIQRPYPVETALLASKITYFVVGIAACLIFAYYTSDLTSRMTGPLVYPVKSFDDVIPNGYSVVVVENGLPHQMLSSKATTPGSSVEKVLRVATRDIINQVHP